MKSNSIAFLHAISFLSHANAEAIIDFLTEDTSSVAEGHQCMSWLLEHKPAMAHEVLCQMYDVAYYRVGDSYFKNTAPAENHEKWFVAPLLSSSLNAEGIPLADSAEQARALAVTHLGLTEIFFKKEEESAFAD